MHFAFFFYVIVNAALIIRLLGHTKQFHPPFETLSIVKRAILDSGTIVIDSIHRIVQELGNLRRVLNAQTYQCKYTYLCNQSVLFLWCDSHFWLQQSIEVVYEVGE